MGSDVTFTVRGFRFQKLGVGFHVEGFRITKEPGQCYATLEYRVITLLKSVQKLLVTSLGENSYRTPIEPLWTPSVPYRVGFTVPT